MTTFEWEDFENQVEFILKKDNPVKPKNSGGTKKEEDVVGKSIIAQCKLNSTKDLHIKAKDIQRLNESSKLLGKKPLFFSKCECGTFLTIQIDQLGKDDLLFLNIIILFKRMENLLDSLEKVSTITEWKPLENEKNNIDKLHRILDNTITDTHKKLDQKITSVINNLTMYNLFEGEKDGFK